MGVVRGAVGVGGVDKGDVCVAVTGTASGARRVSVDGVAAVLRADT